MSNTLWIIVFAAIVTYAIRIGGHIVLSQFKTVHPRVDAGLNAVPAAVMSAIVAPTILNGNIQEWIALSLVVVIGWRFGFLTTFSIAAFSIIAMRYFFPV